LLKYEPEFLAILLSATARIVARFGTLTFKEVVKTEGSIVK
jgi:hypothetical protein